MKLIPEFTEPQHLADPYLGAWYVPDVIPEDLASDVINEVKASGQIEQIRTDTGSSVNQIFERLIVDLTKEHDFTQVEKLGLFLGRKVVEETAATFPAIENFSVDEAAVQIYPAGAELALGWHRDHKNDHYVVISAVLSGSGDISFTEKLPRDEITDEDVIATIHTEAGGVVYFRSTGLYEREDDSTVRVTHAVTKVDEGEERFTIQYRMNVNAASYDNVPVNADRPLRSSRPTLL